MEKDVYSRHIKNYETHWWFKARKNIINSILKSKIKKKKIEILDYGAGSGTNINMLTNFGFTYIYEKDKKTTKYLIKKFNNKKKFKIIKKNYLKKKKFDLIIAADVIEHIKNDKKIINFFHSKLKKSGFLLLTVPAFNFLFSKKDVALKHYKRYNAADIKKILLNKFEYIKLSYYNFFLFLPICILIIIFKSLNVQFISTVEKTPNIIINKLLYLIFNIEKFFLKFINFPFGVSLILLAKKIK